MRIGVLGAGAAGLSCAWLLRDDDVELTVLEREAEPGGLARSFDWHGFPCDFAAHRLFTPDAELRDRLTALTPMLAHRRESQVFFNGAFLNDPVDVLEVARCTSKRKLARLAASYLRRPRRGEVDSFASFVTARYGQELYDFVLRRYTEKLFGIPGDEIALSWAQTKVRLANPLDRFRDRTKKNFTEFHYPVHGGYGAIMDALYEPVADRVKLGASAVALERSRSGAIDSIVYEHQGFQEELPVDVVVSTLPVGVTSRLIGATPPPLEYRAVHAVYLHLDMPRLSNNHWIYFMDDESIINRLVEFKNLSSFDVPSDTTVVCAEVTDAGHDQIDRVIDDLVRCGLLDPTRVLDTKMLTEPYAYPVYDRDYADRLADVEQTFAAVPNLVRVGRAAEFRQREIDDIFSTANEATESIRARYVDALVLA